MEAVITEENSEVGILQDEIYRICSKCKNKWLYAYWDDEIDSYIFYEKEDQECCFKCRDENIG